MAKETTIKLTDDEVEVMYNVIDNQIDVLTDDRDLDSIRSRNILIEILSKIANMS